MLKNFRTYSLAVDFYKRLQFQKLPLELRSQLQKASSSIALNLAEGSGRSTSPDKRRFYSIAFASLRECQAIIELVFSKEDRIWNEADILAAHIFKLIKSCN